MATLIKTTSGKQIFLNDSKDKKIIEFDLYGESKQDGTPTPDNPIDINSTEVSEIKVVGKNFLKNTMTDGTTASGVTFTTQEDKSIALSGENSTQIAKFVAEHTLEDGEYILSGRYNSNCFLRISGYKNGSWAYITQTSSSDNVKFTMDNTVYSKVLVQCVILEDTFIYNAVIYPMIRVAEDEDDTYEPNKDTKVELSKPIILRGIDNIKDTICKQNGVYGVLRNIRHRQIVESDISGKFYHDSSWGNANAFSISNFFSDSVRIANYTTLANIRCTHLVADIPNNITAKTKNKIGQAYYNMFMSVDGITTETQLKTWVNSNEVYVDYLLATPVFEPLTEEDNEKLENLSTFRPITNIFNNANCEMMVKYFSTQIEWEEPKIDWNNKSRFNLVDFNRIRDNLLYLHDLTINKIGPFKIESMGEDLYVGEDEHRNWLVEDFNAIENNLHTISNMIMDSDIGTKKTFYENGLMPDYVELNRIESVILRSKNALDSLSSGLRRLPFELGQYKERI